jgi:Flp pilus assembly CpaF family ATPase
VVKQLAVNIRKFLLRAHRLSDLVALGSLTPQAARFLKRASTSSSPAAHC